MVLRGAEPDTRSYVYRRAILDELVMASAAGPETEYQRQVVVAARFPSNEASSDEGNPT